MWLCRAQCTYWHLWAWHPPVGVCIAILGLLGVIVPLIRDINKIGKWEKATWTFIMFSLLMLEIKSVYQDRNEHDFQQSEAREREERNFSVIASGIQSSIAESDRNFNATMKKTQDSVDSITGGESYVVVAPITSSLVPNQAEASLHLGINACLKCKYVVPGTFVYLQGDLASHDLGVMIAQGAIAPGFTQQVDATIAITVAGERDYYVTVLAGNRPTKEILKVRANHTTGMWEFSYKIYRTEKNPHYNPKTKMAEGEVLKLLEYADWHSMGMTPSNPATNKVH